MQIEVGNSNAPLVFIFTRFSLIQIVMKNSNLKTYISFLLICVVLILWLSHYNFTVRSIVLQVFTPSINIFIIWWLK